MIFPKKCLGCKKEGHFLCDNCFKTVETAAGDNCVICEKKADIANQICVDCSHNFCFDQVFVMNKYDGLIKDLIHALKFDFIEEIDEKMGQLFAKAVDRADLAGKLDKQLILPIPLHKKRYLERGFNQADLIAERIGELCNMRFNKCSLTRIKNTKQQAQLNKAERFENMKDAFSANFEKVPKKVYLFDDVFTTGQTMSEAAKALKKAGVREVNVLALAHGS